MNLKAILASVVLAASSTAMAAPGVTVTANARVDVSTTTVRDHRTDTTYDNRHGVISPPIYQPVRSPPIYQPAPVYTPGWNDNHGGWRRPPIFRTVTLASALRFANDGRTFITVGSQVGSFEKLQITAAGGRTYVEQVYVQFDNGQEQVMRNLNQTLTGDAQLTLDLDGNRRGIKRVIVYGKNLNTGIRATRGFSVMAV